jgi:uncharacterized protein YbjQ (UPF0145 family)
MIVTTTQTVEHRSIGEYLGQVTGQSVWEEKKAREIITGIASGPSEAVAGHKDHMAQARLDAIAEMKTKAEKMGADAIVAIAFDHLVIHDDMLMLFASGTAVKLAEPPLSM